MHPARSTSIHYRPPLLLRFPLRLRCRLCRPTEATILLALRLIHAMCLTVLPFRMLSSLASVTPLRTPHVRLLRIRTNVPVVVQWLYPPRKVIPSTVPIYCRPVGM